MDDLNIATPFAEVDVSSYQPDPDWLRVAASIIAFPDGTVGRIKAASVKATEGVSYTNPFYSAQMNGARVAGLHPGHYHFLRPEIDGTLQAEFYLRYAGWNEAWNNPILDAEVTDGSPAQQVLDNMAAFCEKVESETGRIVMLYFPPSFWAEIGNPTNWSRHKLWIAHYGVASPTPLPPGWTDYAAWQFTSEGNVPGMREHVDVSFVRDASWLGTG